VYAGGIAGLSGAEDRTMRLARYGLRGHERPALIAADGTLRDLSAHTPDISAATLSGGLLARLRAVSPESLPVVPGQPRLGPPVAGIGKLVCVGLNYREHAEETQSRAPAEPILFMKATTALNGPSDPIRMPRGWSKVDWEVELGVVIGAVARYVPEAAFRDYVAGYCIANDVSERAFQLEHGGQWFKGKSCDTFAPLGPWLVTGDEVPDPQALDISLHLNGERMQHSNTRSMIFPVSKLVSYVSAFMTLEPGDVLLTGTPSGVGLGRTPPRFLQPGDELHLSITGLGDQRQRLLAPD
jgi:2,4-didehydro-3-deoxy-L-rhamnonate hydrolase